MEPSIFAFSDFPSFLKAYVKARKKRQTWFSYRWLARRLDLKSHAHLGAIVRGEKIATPELVQELFVVFGLGENALSYALALLRLQSAKTAAERRFAAEAVERLRVPDQTPPLAPAADELLSAWYHIAVLELLGTPHFREDPVWLAAKLGSGLSSAEASASLALLERLSLAVRRQDGSLARAQEDFASTHKIPSAAIRSFHKLMLQRAAASLDDIPIEKRLALGHTLPIDRARLGEAFDLMIEFRQRLHTLLQSKDGGDVYHLAIQLFPLTRLDDI